MCISQLGKAETSLGGVMTPTQLLGMAIKKRRELNEKKERHYRLEVLQTTFIRNLCKSLGERRARRRARKEASENVCEPINQNSSNEGSMNVVVPDIQNAEPPLKQSRLFSPSSPEEDKEDPFGLEAFFNAVKEKKHSGEQSS